MATFTSLPGDIQRLVTQYLNLEDVDNLRRTNRWSYQYLSKIFSEKLRKYLNRSFTAEEIEGSLPTQYNSTRSVAILEVENLPNSLIYQYYLPHTYGGNTQYTQYLYCMVNHRGNLFYRCTTENEGIPVFQRVPPPANFEKLDLYSQHLLFTLNTPYRRCYYRHRFLSNLQSEYSRYRDYSLTPDYLPQVISFHAFLNINCKAVGIEGIPNPNFYFKISPTNPHQLDTSSPGELEKYQKLKDEIERLYPRLYSVFAMV